MPTDYYMHNLKTFNEIEKENLVPYTQWVKPIIMKHLPYSTCDANKIVKELIRVHSKELEMIDFYSNYHLPYQLTSFEEHIAYQIGHQARHFMPTYRTNFSPFQPGRRMNDGRGSFKNPSLTGQSSTSSAASSNSSSTGEDSSSDDDAMADNKSSIVQDIQSNSTFVSFAALLPSMTEVYGTEPKTPDGLNLLK